MTQKIVWLGDSTIAFSNAQTGFATSLVYNGNRTATITFNVDQGIRVGDSMQVMGAMNANFNTDCNVECIARVGNSYTYPLTSDTMPTGKDISSEIVLSYPHRKSAAGPIWLTHNMTNRAFEHINSGRNGGTISEALSRFDRCVKRHSPDVVIVCFGINDVYGKNKSITTLQTEMEVLRQSINGIGADMIIITPLPQPNTRPGFTSQKNITYIAFTRWLVRFATEKRLSCVVWGDCVGGGLRVQDSSSATANPSSGMLNADLVHALSSANYLLAKQLSNLLVNKYRPDMTRKLARDVTSGGLLTNPTFSGTGGTIAPGGTGTVAAGNIATGLAIRVDVGTGTVTPSQVARTIATDGDTGNWQQFSFVAVAAGDSFTVSFPNLASVVTSGNTIQHCMLARIVSGSANCRELSYTVNSQTSVSGNLFVSDMLLGTSQMSPIPENIEMILGTDIPVRSPSSVHGTPTNCIPVVRVTAAGAGTIVVQFAMTSAEKV